MLRATLAFLLVLSFAGFAMSRQSSSNKPVYVRGSFTKSGHYVAPHYRTRPDRYFANNWSAKGNENPWNQKKGTQKKKPLTHRPTIKVFHKQKKQKTQQGY